MKVKIKKLNSNAVIPTQGRVGDFCYDVIATSCREVEPGIWEYGTGLAYEIERKPTPWYGPCTGLLGDINLEQIVSHHSVKLSLDFRPRSSVWKTGMILSNCVGTLDEFYRGEMMAYFYEVIPGKEKYKVGDRIGQIKLGITLPLEFEEVDEIDMNTERGTGGFGSTGK